MTDATDRSIRLEMGYSVDEFVRVLPAAMRDWPVSGGPAHWLVGPFGSGALIGIEAVARPERCIGALRLPVLDVIIRPGDITDTDLKEFKRRFDRGFHRGGG